jgi:hypothetical protein
LSESAITCALGRARSSASPSVSTRSAESELDDLPLASTPGGPISRDVASPRNDTGPAPGAGMTSFA